MKGLRRICAAGVVCASMAWATGALAQSTTTYTYDALGRVTGVQQTGGPANGTSSVYTYDAASNRTNVTVSGSPNGTSSTDTGSGASVPATKLFVVVPLNGYTLIPIN